MVHVCVCVYACVCVCVFVCVLIKEIGKCKLCLFMCVCWYEQVMSARGQGREYKHPLHSMPPLSNE